MTRGLGPMPPPLRQFAIAVKQKAVARSADCVVAVVELRIFRTGFLVEYLGVARLATPDPFDGRRSMSVLLESPPGDERAAEFLRIGLDPEMSRGGVPAVVATKQMGSQATVERDGSVAVTRQLFWVEPLPPVDVSFVIDWPAFGVVGARHTITAGELHGAASDLPADEWLA